jgi:EAL domain-containing protein (putative c-di-GMP-specific phosphodiesterase class I)
VVEVVERPAQAELLRAASVRLVQGFLFARPIPAEDFPAWLAHEGSPVPQTLPSQT